MSSKKPDNSQPHSHTESMPSGVVYVYFTKDGGMTFSEKQWPISHNELLLIIPKPLVSELKNNVLTRESYSKHMMRFFLLLGLSTSTSLSPLLERKWKDLLTLLTAH